ncbi:substrate-binding domain-containing protein [Amycolatopsis sp. FDAARGOS 1241]|uniref:sugar ABC transporter substrate-binding protein n=1 Tax=Amycolatopsis sp. FDAARGOS 1241 TaxID=2778070 RepID=UPI0019503021|nr:substrate-binding domain-containing protein [Amycolatopsis sp. FDAARGOS 1241]QRP42840.1 hypothetical protein I6J71_25590 [Amycolatopsis sp. FDAARGOS 1241]
MRNKRWLGAAAGLVFALFVTSCTSAAESGAGGGGGPVDAAAARAGLAEAKEIVEKAQKFPATIPVTEPLPAKPPSGRTFVFLQCDQATCPLQGNGVRAAAAAIGWDVKTLNWKQSDPATLVTAMRTALQYHPVAVSFTGLPQELWKTVQPQFKAAGVAIIPSSLPTAPTGDAVIPGRAFEKDEAALGQLLAAAYVADDNGAHGKALMVTVPDYPVYKPVVDTFGAEVSRLCPGCSTSVLNVTLSQLQAGQLNAAIVSKVKTQPDIKYIVSVNSQFISQLPQALRGANLDGKFKILGGKGNSVDQANVLNGTQLATVDSPFLMGGWQDVDEAIRFAMGLPVPEGDHSAAPILLTKNNIGKARDSYDVPVDYADQFMKLWKLK